MCNVHSARALHVHYITHQQMQCTIELRTLNSINIPNLVSLGQNFLEPEYHSRIQFFGSGAVQGLPTYRVWWLWLKMSLHWRTPRQKSFPTLARAACTPHERQPQKHTRRDCIRETCKSVVGGASRLACRVG